MESLSIIIPFIFIGGAGALVLFIVAVIQEGRTDHRGGFRTSFFTIVSLVMLTITVGSSIALLGIGLRQYVFRSATLYQQRYNSPPVLSLPSQGGVILEKGQPVGGVTAPVPSSTTTSSTTAYACTKDCQFTTDDKTAVTAWVTNYEQWQHDQSLSVATRRSLANALGFFIVALPLYWFFFRWVQRQRRQDTTGKPSPLRSLYFYGVAFAGLVMAVVAAGIVVNDGLNVWLKTGTSTGISQPVLAPTTDLGVTGLIACQSKCGFTADQVALARQWSSDNAKYVAIQQSNKGQYSNDLSMAIPFILVGLPLFLYHFTSIRKDTPETTSPPTTIS